MTWVRIDDQFDEHPKHQQAGPLAWALWAAGLAYCNRNLTDGFIPTSKAQTLVNWKFTEPPREDGRQRVVSVGITSGFSGDDVTNDYVINLLISAGLWAHCDGGYKIHDYKDYQPSRKKVLEERRQIAERVSRFKQRKGNAHSNAVTNAVSGADGNGISNGVNNAKVTPAPVPVPVPSSESTKVLEPDAAAGAKGDPLPGGNGKGTGKALKDLLTKEDTIRVGLLARDIDVQTSRDRDRFQPWACLQRMVSGGLPKEKAIEILRRLRDAGNAAKPVRVRWAYAQEVCDREHLALHIRLQEQEHMARKTVKPNLEEMAAIMRGIKEKHPGRDQPEPQPDEGGEAFS